MAKPLWAGDWSKVGSLPPLSSSCVAPELRRSQFLFLFCSRTFDIDGRSTDATAPRIIGALFISCHPLPPGQREATPDDRLWRGIQYSRALPSRTRTCSSFLAAPRSPLRNARQERVPLPIRVTFHDPRDENPSCKVPRRCL